MDTKRKWTHHHLLRHAWENEELRGHQACYLISRPERSRSRRRVCDGRDNRGSLLQLDLFGESP
ncbi:hypothetical protein I3760_15G073200 [Carya illinoinensis]|uniref:Uncharacterized protein n=1 Tax=Carya illinoinensis TaxID=32201 RepID=A0A922AC57_CARIL|nr:hypothetical protein I3760_15G073200 [Carya illinoinensis]KAG6674970.1 hypothetical protein I3842_15G074600 [Carya illinoinensis]